MRSFFRTDRGKPLSLRERQALDALVREPSGSTYPEAAERLGISTGTLHTYLARAKRKRPELYYTMMYNRQRQLKRRHTRALEKAKVRRKSWYEGRRLHASTNG